LVAETNKYIVCNNCKQQNTYSLNLPIVISCNSCSSSFIVDETKSIVDLAAEPLKLNTVSVLNLQTKGISKGEPFELIGFIRSVNTLFISNEWLMYFESGKYLWLIESSFRYFVSDSKVIAMSSHAVKGIVPGRIVNINSKEYVLLEITKQIDFYFQGEIPVESYNDSSFFKYELVAKDESNFASVCIFSAAQIDASFSEKVQLEDLQLEQTNVFNDWK